MSREESSNQQRMSTVNDQISLGMTSDGAGRAYTSPPSTPPPSVLPQPDTGYTSPEAHRYVVVEIGPRGLPRESDGNESSDEHSIGLTSVHDRPSSPNPVQDGPQESLVTTVRRPQSPTNNRDPRPDASDLHAGPVLGREQGPEPLTVHSEISIRLDQGNNTYVLIVRNSFTLPPPGVYNPPLATLPTGTASSTRTTHE